MEIKTEYSGISELLEGIDKLPAHAEKALQEAATDDLNNVAKLLANYPAARGIRYARTGTLGLGWLTAQAQVVVSSGLNFEVKVANSVSYAGYVQGGRDSTPGQAWMHRGIWQTTDQALAATENLAKDKIEVALQTMLNSLGK